MKVFSVKINVCDEDKYHVVTADKKDEVEAMVKDFWFDDESLEIIRVEEVTKKEVIITKHN